MPVVMDADRIGRTLTRIAHEILERNKGADDLVLGVGLDGARGGGEGHEVVVPGVAVHHDCGTSQGRLMFRGLGMRGGEPERREGSCRAEGLLEPEALEVVAAQLEAGLVGEPREPLGEAPVHLGRVAARVAVKAGKMAVQAHLKVAGVVENMGYAECPDCGKELRIFGGDGGERVAGELGTEVLGRIPMVPDATGEPGRSLFEVDSTPARVFDEIAAALAQIRVRRRIKVL